MPSRKLSEEIAFLKTERERLRQEHAAGASGLAIVRGISDAVDEAVRRIWERRAPPGRAALVAVGGYGRREMSPFSDVDLMVLHSGGRGVKEAGKELFYELWDAGMDVGHSIRTAKEALKVARADLDAETAFLEGRLVAGDESLFDEFFQAALAHSRSSPAAFLRRIAVAARGRLGRAGDASSELEPNVKDGRGGLRDLHALRWIGTVCGAIESDPSLEGAAELLHRVRNELHFLTGRHSDVLLMQLQSQVAAAVISPAPGRSPEDELMRALYERCRAVAYALDEVLGDSIAPDIPALDSTWTPPSRAEFVGLLALGERGRAAFRALEQSGALSRALPEWEWIRWLPQRNVYHRYPVDVHAFETVVALAGLAEAPDELTRRVVQDAREDWATLLVAALLHDIGKGTDEDHSIRGEALGRSAAERIGFSPPAVGDIAWLVRHHLLLSDTATRRDIGDENLVVELAESVGTARRLRMLYLLSVADGIATSSSAWTPWKAALVADLFMKVSHVLERGELVSRDASGLARIRVTELREALSRFSPAAVEHHLSGMPRAWLLSQSATELIRQSALMIEPLPGDGPHLHATPSGDPGIWEVTVIARDRPGLFSNVSGALALHGLNVLSANIFTRDDSLALEVFRVESVDPDYRRIERVAEDARKAMRGRISLDVRLANKRQDYAARVPRGKQEAPRVVVDNRVSDFYTVIEVHASDRIALLYTITRALSDLELDIHLAKVATYGEDVVDTFYVRDLEGQKVTDLDHANEIERSIVLRLSPDS